MWTTLFFAACTWIPEGALPKLGADSGCTGVDVWYDGVDSDCDGASDYDKDGDGFDSASYGGTDCWDDPDMRPGSFEPRNGFPSVDAADVHVDALDTWYDGIDQDCDGVSDFDQDADGYDTSNEAYPGAGGVGTDCYDAVEDAYPDSGTVTVAYLPAEVHPGALDPWYDGTDQDCDGADDYDQDGDGYELAEECDDTDPARYPDPELEELWYDSVDDNCDGNRYDKDFDGHDSAVYGGDDCWDDTDVVPDGYAAINGFSQPNADEVYPEAEDLPYDGVDSDCADDEDFDADDDGSLTDAWPDGEGVYGDDCDDTDDTVFPAAIDDWYDGIDADCSGDSDYDADGDGSESEDYGGDDCDDTRAAVNPSENEACATASDDDCDGELDREDADGCTTFNLDFDGDGYGSGASQCWCEEQSSTDYDVTNDDDCDDTSASIQPGADEVCDSADADEDCDGLADDDDSSALVSGKTRYYPDDDLDGDGDEDHVGALVCDDPGPAWTPTNTDCDDADDGVYPGATEVCDGADNDCDGSIDDSAAGVTWYADADADTYGDPSSTVTSCAQPSGYVSDATDCDDTDSEVYPGASETCDSVDQDCDGAVDDGAVDASTWYADADGDTYGDATDTQAGCDAPAGYVADDTDCDDASSGDYPGATEIVGNGDDENCDGSETCYDDDDNDGYLDTTADTRSSTDTDCSDSNEGTNTDLTTDCDDASSTDYPGATEIVGNGDDESCDGAETCYDDDDNDGFLDTTGDTRSSSDTDCSDSYEGTNTDLTTDCDDASSTDYPGATEIVGNGDDESCDGSETCYDDDDNDGYLDTTGDTRVSSDTDCSDSSEGGSSDPTTDCDDSDNDTYPGSAALELVTSCTNDDDNDGYGDSTVSALYVEGTDCDDSDSGDYPGATETVGNGDDESCDGTETCYDDDDNDLYLDSTGDTRSSSDTDCSDTYEGIASDPTTDCDDTSFTVHPGASDPIDGTDQDCDGADG